MRRDIELEPTEVIFDKDDPSKIIYMASAETTRNLAKSPELVAMEDLLKNYDYELVNSTNKMRQFILANLFKMTQDANPNIAYKALETLGRVTEIGLFTTRIEVSVSDKPTSDLETELKTLLRNYSKTEKNVVEELTDAELRGYDQVEEEDIDDGEYTEMDINQ